MIERFQRVLQVTLGTAAGLSGFEIQIYSYVTQDVLNLPKGWLVDFKAALDLLLHHPGPGL